MVQIPAKAAFSLIVSLSKSLSLYFMCSDQHVEYWVTHGFPLTSCLLLDYHVKQYMPTNVCFPTVMDTLWNYVVVLSVSQHVLYLETEFVAV